LGLGLEGLGSGLLGEDAVRGQTVDGEKKGARKRMTEKETDRSDRVTDETNKKGRKQSNR